MALPRGVMGLSALCDCGISYSSSLTIFHEAADFGKIPSELLPPVMQNSTPFMEDFSISVAGILKLLKI